MTFYVYSSSEQLLWDRYIYINYDFKMLSNLYSNIPGEYWGSQLQKIIDWSVTKANFIAIVIVHLGWIEDAKIYID